MPYKLIKSLKPSGVPFFFSKIGKLWYILLYIYLFVSFKDNTAVLSEAEM